MLGDKLYKFNRKKSAAGENFENSSSLKIVIYVFRAVIYVENRRFSEISKKLYIVACFFKRTDS